MTDLFAVGGYCAAMPETKVEVVRRAIDAFNRRDLRELAVLCHDDLEFVSVLTAIEADGATYRGPDAWSTYFGVMDQIWRNWRAEDPRLFEGAEDTVVCLFRIAGTGSHSDVPVERPIAITYRFKDERIWRMRSYMDPADALAAAGVGEGDQPVRRSNADIIEAAYAALDRRDLDGFLAVAHPEVEFRSLLAEAEGQTFRGHDGVREWWGTVAHSLGGVRYERERAEGFRDRGIVRIRLVGNVDGVEVPQTMWQAWRVRDGLLAWWNGFRTEAEALDAVGLGE